MARTTAELLIDRLADWGVDTVFGLPGDGINGIFEALRTRQERVRFIQVRHEEAAAFAACGYAKFTDSLGVCMATSGPGGIHLLNGLYDAKCDGQPVLAIAATGKQWLSFNAREDLLHGLAVGAKVGVARSGERKPMPAVVTELVPLGPFATWQAERAIGDHDRNTLRLRLDLEGDPTGFEPGMTVWLVR